MTEYLENNHAAVSGEITEDFVLSHEIYGEKFYICTIKIPRLSGIYDFLKVMVSERLLGADFPKVGDIIDVEGQFRSYNSFDESGNRLVLTVFAKELTRTNDGSKNPNSLYLNGYICKEPVYRTTPFGREITDMLIAVNRTYNKSDYIPIIAWGRNARYSKDFEVGDNIKVWGRIQSRNYQKRTDDDEFITRTAYEVSVNRMEK